MRIKNILWVLFLVLAIIGAICHRAILMDASRVAFYVVAGKSFYFDLPFMRILNFILQAPSVLGLRVFNFLEVRQQLTFFTWTYTLAPLVYLVLIDFCKRHTDERASLLLPLFYLVAILPGLGNQFSTVSEGVIVFALMMSFRKKWWIQYLAMIGLIFSHESSLLYLSYFLVFDKNKGHKLLASAGIIFILYRIFNLEAYVPNSSQWAQVAEHPLVPVIVGFIISPFIRRHSTKFFIFTALMSLTLLVVLDWRDNMVPHSFRNLSALLAILIYEIHKRKFEISGWTVIVLAFLTSVFDIGLSLKYREMNKENEISYQNSKIKQNANSKKEFTRLLKEIECSGIVIQKPYYTTPRLAINQLLQSGKAPHP